MAYIITTDQSRHTVKETKDHIDDLIGNTAIRVIKLNLMVSVTSWEAGAEKDTQRFEPVSFLKENIVMWG